MNTLLSLAVVLLAGALVIEGKRFKRDLKERNILEAAHVVKDVEGLQCILDTAPQCEKDLYFRDLKDELRAMRTLLEKLRGIDWFGGGHNDIWTTVEEDEWELLELWYELQGLLPQTFDMKTGTTINFGHFIENCGAFVEDYTQEPDCDSAKRKAMDLLTQCEATGFQQALSSLDSADVNDAQNLKDKMRTLLEILAEVRDLNYVALGVAYIDCADFPTQDSLAGLIEKATKPEHIGEAVVQLFSLFGDYDKRNLAKKKTLTEQARSVQIPKNVYTKANNKSAYQEKIQSLLRGILKKYQ